MADSFARSLTQRKIESAKPKRAPYKLTDGGGMFLLVKPDGAKLWRYKFRISGHESSCSLGSFPEIGLATAREKHREARALVSRGTNPSKHGRAQEALKQEELRRQELGTFETVALDWMATTSSGLAESSRAQRKREVEREILPNLGPRLVNSITRRDLFELLQPIVARAPETARNVRLHLKGIFDYAVAGGLITGNPTPDSKVLGKRAQKSHAALGLDRIPEFMKALHSSGANVPTKTALRLVMLTLCRKTEVTRARWSEFNMEAAEWRLPAERMKNKLPHQVPLSSQAVELLRELRKVSYGQFLFPHRDKPHMPMADRTLNALMERIGFSAEAKVHGFRAMASTYLNEAGWNRDAVERALAHQERDKVRAAYNRGEYWEERRRMLQAWANLLDGLAEGKVAQIKSQVA